MGIIDKNKDIKFACGCAVYLPSEISNFHYDFIVIAIDSLQISEAVHRDLIENYGCDEKKIIHAALYIFENRVLKINQTNTRLMLSNIGSRIDKRLIRLEILQYYSLEDNYNSLDDEKKAVLTTIQNENDLGFRIFPEDTEYVQIHEDIPDIYTEQNLYKDELGFYTLVNKRKLYFGWNRKAALHMMNGFFFQYESDSPHKYLSPEDDGIDILNNSVIADVGACEGYFGIKYLDRCRKTYFFECDKNWIIQLNKSVSNLSNAEIVEGIVGDKPGQITLDKYFEEREDPDVIKIDVEGMELSVLRGTKN